MTDRFEDAVRDAARDLASGQGDLPTYHDAWHRGRRRRFVKRSALAAAGVLVFVAALSVNLGRFPGSDSTNVDDVALVIPASTPSAAATEVPTTAPVDAPTPNVPAATVVIPTAPPVDPTPNTAQAAPAPTSIPTATPRPAAVPTSGPTAVPTPAPAPTDVATPAPTVAPVIETPTATPNPFVAPEDDESASIGATGTGPDAAALATDPERRPGLALTTGGVGQPAAAVVLGPALGDDLPCDIDADGLADATCDLLPDYACQTDVQIKPGFERIDSDGDGVGDTCTAVGLTVCDTVGDGLGDTPCIIQFETVGDVSG